MLKTFGKIFKVIRESKNMSLKEVAAGDISVAQLSRFERGVSGITLDSFYYCLKNMAVSLDEFQYVYHGKATELAANPTEDPSSVRFRIDSASGGELKGCPVSPRGPGPDPARTGKCPR